MGLTTMQGAVAAAAAATPDGPALTVDEETFSWRELWNRSAQLAHALERHGVEPGALVSLLLGNSRDFVAGTLATMMVGATPQPLSVRLPGPERDAVLAVARPALVLAESAVELDLPTLRVDALASAEVDVPERFLTTRSPSWKAPTSGGSTGRPKVIVATRPGELDAESAEVGRTTRLPIGEAVVVPGPLHHNAPFTFALIGLMRRNHVIVSSRFDAARTLAQVERHGASYLYVVPTMMNRIWRLPAAERDAFDLRSLRVVLHTAAACPAWLKEAWMDWLGDEVVWELYGSTEGHANTMINGTEWRTHRGSVGRVVVGEMRILGEDGRELPPGEVGEIYMRSAAPAYRYLGAEARRIDDGWETLGDLGSIDADGYVYIAERRVDMIVRGGSNVYPAEVEAAIEQHPGVHEAVVVGLPDDDLGQVVHAVVRAEPGVSDEELTAFAAARISRYKVPATWERADERLRDDAGKVRRSAIRERCLARRAGSGAEAVR